MTGADKWCRLSTTFLRLGLTMQSSFLAYPSSAEHLPPALVSPYAPKDLHVLTKLPMEKELSCVMVRPSEAKLLGHE